MCTTGLSTFYLIAVTTPRFNGILSAIAFISASIVQGSVLGPCSFVMEASDLKPQNPINLLLKYADDTDLIVPASHSHTVQVELDGISRWASDNNLTLNVSKSCEMIVRDPRTPADLPSIPPPIPGLARVSALEVLGVSFSDRLDFSEHFRVAVCAGFQVHLCPQGAENSWPSEG